MLNLINRSNQGGYRTYDGHDPHGYILSSHETTTGGHGYRGDQDCGRAGFHSHSFEGGYQYCFPARYFGKKTGEIGKSKYKVDEFWIFLSSYQLSRF